MSKSKIIYIPEMEGIVASFEQTTLRGKKAYKIIVEVLKEKMAFEVYDFVEPPIGAFARICGDGEVIISNNVDDNSDDFNYKKYLKSYPAKKGWKFFPISINDFNVISDPEVFELIRDIKQGLEYYHNYLIRPNRFHDVKKYLTRISKNMTAFQVKIQNSLLVLDSDPKVGKTR